MKSLLHTLVRILIMLVAALTVVGATIALTDNSSTTQAPAAFVQQDGSTTLAQSGDSTAVMPVREHPEGGEEGNILAGMAGLLGNLGIVSVIILGVVQLQRIPWQRLLWHKGNAASI